MQSDRLLQPEQMIDVAEKTVMIQRDYGDRSVRKHARFKYTIDDRGIEWFIDELSHAPWMEP